MHLLPLALALVGAAGGLSAGGGATAPAERAVAAPAGSVAFDASRLEGVLRDAFCADPGTAAPSTRAGGRSTGPAAPLHGSPVLGVLKPASPPTGASRASAAPAVGRAPPDATGSHSGCPTAPGCPGAGIAPLLRVRRFLDWLSIQDWVLGVRTPFAEGEGHVALLFLTSVPAQVPIEVDVRLPDGSTRTLVVYLEVQTPARIHFAGSGWRDRVD